MVVTLLKNIPTVKEIYKGALFDIDYENRSAYQKYPFPFPHEKPDMSGTKVVASYEKYEIEDVKNFLNFIQLAFNGFLRIAKIDIDIFKEKTVLDLGAGIGWDSILLAQSGAKKVYSVDYSKIAIQQGRRFCQMLNVNNVEHIECSLYEIDKLGINPDVIICKGVLHHIFDLKRVAGALRKISEKGTQIIIQHSSPATRLGFIKYLYNHLAWSNRNNDLERRIDAGIKLFSGWNKKVDEKIIRYRVNDLAGVFYMARSAREIRNIFKENGFEVVRIKENRYSEWFERVEKVKKRLVPYNQNLLSKCFKLILIFLILEPIQFLSKHILFLDHLFGNIFSWLFTMESYVFRITLNE